MDQDYLQMLLEMIQSQYAQGGGGPTAQFGDPFAPSGGFPSQPMPNGKMPQYRTQGSGFVSDGTTRDLVGQVLTDQDDFSTDALFAVDPRLKPLISRAVAENAHDPYGTYASFDDPEYRQALLQMAAQDAGIEQEFNPAMIEGLDGDGDGQVDVDMYGRPTTEWSNDQGIEALVAQLEGQTPDPVDTGFVDPLSGRMLQKGTTYEEILQEKMGGYENALDDFFTQSAPSMERNQNNLDFAWGESGGMPYHKQAGGPLDYAGSGPGFMGSDAGSGGGNPYQEYVRAYMDAAVSDRSLRAPKGGSRSSGGRRPSTQQGRRAAASSRLQGNKPPSGDLQNWQDAQARRARRSRG